MHQFKIFIALTRLNKPIGFLLLFWPCSWGLALAYNENQNLQVFLYYLLLFFLGSVLMRSAGCIINDVVDKDLDKKVKRTKMRPLASGKISTMKAFTYAIILCIFAFIILIQFNPLTIKLGLISMIFAFSYPFMKRITYWPQLFLGFTFNWGIIMANTAINNEISISSIILYVSAIFWTLGYDTVYGAQDVNDDEIIGVKSTSIKFKKKMKLFVSINYFLSSVILVFLFLNTISLNMSSFFIFLFMMSLIYQILIFKKSLPNTCLKAFKLNNYSGLFLFLGIFLNNF